MEDNGKAKHRLRRVNMEELKYREQAKKFIEDRGFSGIANQEEVEGLMSAFTHKLASDGDLASVVGQSEQFYCSSSDEGQYPRCETQCLGCAGLEEQAKQ